MAEVTRADLGAAALKNLAALAAGGQELALAWIRQAPEIGPVSVTETGVVLAGGRSQASHRDPEAEARAWLAATAPGPGEAILFGFGQPWAARLLLASRPLTVFEPDPLVALAVLSRHDFSADLATARLRLLTPWHLANELADNSLPEPGAILLASPAARRRAPAQLAQLTRLLAEPRPHKPAGPDFRLLIIPPLSGGPEPVAEALARVAAKTCQTLYLDWGAELKAREKAAQGPASADKDRVLTDILEQAGRRAAEVAARFRPDLALALAQAPLTIKALNRLRDQSPATVLAFWLVEDFRLFPHALETAPAYDIFFHIQEGLIEPALRNAGLNRAHYLPLAADPDFFKPRQDIPPAFRAELSFMGAGYPNRVRLLEDLAAAYWPRTGRPAAAFKIFGSGWPRTGRLAGHLFENGRRISSAECALIYAGGRVNLNLHSSLRDEAAFDDSGRFLNPRAFEIAAAGGLQIMDPRPLSPFIPGREVAVAGRPADLPDLIGHYLNQPEEAAALGRAARALVLAEHTYAHRLEQLLAGSGFQAAYEKREESVKSVKSIESAGKY